VFVGIDISKHHLDVALLDPTSGEVSTQRYRNDASGQRALLKALAPVSVERIVLRPAAATSKKSCVGSRRQCTR
jgi:hypothetical protein